MFWNYIKSALRNLRRNKIYSIINIAGLAIGMGASILIAMWVFDELSYDKFHERADDIYRVERDIFFEGEAFVVPITGAIYGRTLITEYPEVENMVRINPIQLSIEDVKKRRFNERVFFADSSFFDVFTFPLAKGDPTTALVEPRSIVLSQEAARKFFGDKDPINKMLRLDWDDEMVNFKVTGVLKKLPKNKHFKFEILASLSTLEDAWGENNMYTWVNNNLYTYVMLRKGTDLELFNKKMDELVANHIMPAYMGYFNAREETDARMSIKLRPVSKIHLKSGLMWDIEPQGDITMVWVFSIVSILILLIACFNFMNLSTALAGTRALEIGIRKTIGSTKSQITSQFLGESIIMAIVSFLLAVLLIEICLPTFNLLTDKELSMNIFFHWDKLLILSMIILGTGFISGIYPALYLSAIKPIIVLKGKAERTKRKFSFRQVLVIVQFSISIALIIGSVTAFRQLNYIQSRPLGYNKQNLMVLPVESNFVRTHYDVFKNELLAQPMITHVTMSQQVPAESNYSDTGWETDLKEELFLSTFFAVDEDFFETYKLEMKAGRPFSRDYTNDAFNRYILNESAIRKIGYKSPEEAIGGRYYSEWVTGNLGNNADGKIVGVVKDFHFKSMRNPIEPLTLFVAESSWMNRISIRYLEGNEMEALAVIEDAWYKHFPDIEFYYSYVEDYLNKYYVAEEKMKDIILSFTILAIFVACLGLFGLATFSAGKRIKEIGIRKVMGASTRDIMMLISKSFFYWILLANIIAWPLAYFFMEEWLASFPYRVNIHLVTFVGAAFLAILIGLATVSFRAYRAANANPVESIKYE